MSSSERPRETAPGGGMLGGRYVDGDRIEGPGLPVPVTDKEPDDA